MTFISAHSSHGPKVSSMMRNMHSLRARRFRMAISRANFHIVPMISQTRAMCYLQLHHMHKPMALVRLRTQLTPMLQYLQVSPRSLSQRQVRQPLTLHSTRKPTNFHHTAKTPLPSPHTSLARIPIITLSIPAIRWRTSMTPSSSLT